MVYHLIHGRKKEGFVQYANASRAKYEHNRLRRFCLPGEKREKLSLFLVGKVNIETLKLYSRLYTMALASSFVS